MPIQFTPPATGTGDAAAPSALRAAAFLKPCWHWFQERCRGREPRISLHDLSERELIDIGMTRAEIDHITAHRRLDRLRDGMAYPWMR